MIHNFPQKSGLFFFLFSDRKQNSCCCVLYMNVNCLVLCTQESFSFENYLIWLELCRALKTFLRGDEHSAYVSVSKWFGRWEQIIRPKQLVLRLLCLHCSSSVSGFCLRAALIWTVGWNAVTRGAIWSCSRDQSLAWTPVSLLQDVWCTPGVESLQTESLLKRIQGDMPELLREVTQMCWVGTAGGPVHWKQSGYVGAASKLPVLQRMERHGTLEKGRIAASAKW